MVDKKTIGLVENQFLLPRKKILKKRKDIKKILQSGRKLRGNIVNIFILPAQKNQFAVLVPRRIGNAVKRNRMKRLAREIYRKNQNNFKHQKVIFSIKEFSDNYSLLTEDIRKAIIKQ